MAHDVFISYATSNKPVADAAVTALEVAGVRCWVAPRDIIPGSNYMGSITDAIRNARAVVLIFSAEANASVHVSREIQQAVEIGLPILPLKIDDADPTDSLSYALVGTHWLDAMTAPLEHHLQRLTAAVDALVGTGGQPSLPKLAPSTATQTQVEGNVSTLLQAPPPPHVEPRFASLAGDGSSEPAPPKSRPQTMTHESTPGTSASPDAKTGKKHWWLFPLLSFGLLAPVPFIRAATLSRSRRWVLSALVVSILSISMLVFPSSSEAAGAYYFFVWVGTTIFGWVSATAWAQERRELAQAAI